MPLYDYACPQCGRVLEVRHGFNESYGKPCEACGAPLRRVFNPAPVLFKGPGFYVTDSRRPGASSKSDKPKEEAPPTGATGKADPAPAKEPTPSNSSDSAA
jgi:putative FmdB family regulatory protein